MAYQITISILCAIIAGIARAVSNKVVFHYRSSVFRYKEWFNPDKSWRNKWKLENGNPKIVNGKKVERYFGSSTIFVLFTDAFHLFEFLFRIAFATSFIIATLLLNKSVWFAFSYLIIYLIFAGTFHIFFTFIFTRQPKEHKNPSA